MKKQTKKWSDMDATKLQNATMRYDAEFAADLESKPLTAAQREAYRKAQKVGLPKLGKGSRDVSLSFIRQS